jgi:hypothetical protein
MEFHPDECNVLTISQKANFDKNKIKERQLLALVNIINTEKKGLDQEYYIENL